MPLLFRLTFPLNFSFESRESALSFEEQILKTDKNTRQRDNLIQVQVSGSGITGKKQFVFPVPISLDNSTPQTV
jgi:hypothetical protein